MSSTPELTEFDIYRLQRGLHYKGNYYSLNKDETVI